ncbi:MAG: hypothetical protein OXD01_16085 [Gammaproteobacteria bacterium]|nr:hypothetical protein [Gammaproteobacteria bacterium]
MPEPLLLAHARSEVIFISGAGVSQPADLPDFRQLVFDVYETLDPPVQEVLTEVPASACNQWQFNYAELTDRQSAEIQMF